MDRIGIPMRRKNIKAWLITWEGDHGRDDRVVMLLHPKMTEQRVGELIELLYANAYGTLGERLVYAVERDHFNHPYRARRAERSGQDWECHLMCGVNPYLYARPVEQVSVEQGEDGAELLQWREVDG
jgi:hypothetical protein